MIKSLQLIKQQFLTSLENQTSQKLLQSVLAFPIVSASSPQNTLKDHSTKQERYKIFLSSPRIRDHPRAFCFFPPLGLTKYLANLPNGDFSLLNKTTFSIQIQKKIKEL